MSQPDTTPLWCIHIKVSDDIIPMPDRTTADKKTNHFNEEWTHFIDSPAPAHVIEWPDSADTHAAQLAELRENDEDGWLT